MLSRISSAVFTHLNGVPRLLWASTYARIAARNCAMLVCEPRFKAFSVSNPKKRSTRLSHEASVGGLRQSRPSQLALEHPESDERADGEHHAKAGDIETSDSKQDGVNGCLLRLERRPSQAQRVADDRH